MTIYTHNGVYYDLPTDDPELAKQKIKAHLSGPETAAQTAGRSAASMADSLLGLPGAALGEAAYAGYRFKQGAESLANAAMGKGFLPTPTAPAEKFREQFQFQAPGNKLTVGRLTGTEGTQGYQNAPLKSAGQAVGQFIEEGAVQPIAEVTGIPAADVGNIMGTLSAGVAPAVPKVGRAVVNTARALPDVATGAINTLGGQGTKPGQRATYAGQYESARQPAGLSYNTANNLQDWRDVNISTAELNNRAVPYTAEQAAALKRTGGMVPYGKENVARATGEALAEPYTKLSGYIPDIATAAIGYGLLGPGGALALPALNLVRRGVGLYNAGQTAGKMNQLGNLGFKPLYADELNAINRGLPHPSDISGIPAAGAIRSQTPQTMAAAQVNPAMATTPAAQAAVATTQAKTQTVPPSRQLGYTPSTMYVAPEGVAGTNLQQVGQTALQQRYAPQPVAGAVKPQPEPQVQPMPQTAAPESVGLVRNAEQIAAQTQKNKQEANLANQQRIEKMTWEALQQRIANGGKPMFNEQKFIDDVVAKYGDNPFGTGTLTAPKFKVETPAIDATPNTGSLVATAKTETPAVKVVTAEQQAKRDKFINEAIPTRVENMKQQRSANKEQYAEEAEMLREMAADRKAKGKKDFPMWGKYSEGQNVNPKDVFTERKAVANMIKDTTIGNVTSKNKQIVVRQQGYNQFADDAGITLDWDTAPKVDGMSIKQARKVMNKWTFDQFNKELPDLGLYKRSESFKSMQKRLEKEAINNPPPPLSAEEQARLDAIPTRTMDSNSKLKSLLNKGESPKLSTPKTTTPVETQAARPEGVPEPAPLTKAQLLEMIKNRGKGK